ncbi:hypothetical protein PG996_003030 [Apiospora saccharicola]|uniref:Zn(2)-C6 fungal-type domain-containing protein n=1 Tax=Apiospora saccharicola TaxID=335842 RepID=A0ABR1W037_9PEZI
MPSRRVPPERRKRTEISCDKCKSRKQKCHRLLSESSPDGYDSRAPCRYCQTHGFECVTTQTRKKRVFAAVEESLEARVGLLESLVKGLVPDADTSSVEGLRALGASLGIAMPEVPDTRRSSGTPAGAAFSGRGDVKEGSGKASAIAHEEKRQEEQTMPVLRDQQGQMQYIGPASSYIFQIRMRAILAGRNSHCQSQGQFFLFANNVTDKAWVGKVADLQREMSAGRTPRSHEAEDIPAASDGSQDDDDSDDEREASVRTDESLLSGTIPDQLVEAFFERIHPDFPVLSEECFRRKYERFREQKSSPLGSGGGGRVDVDASWVCSFLCILILARRTIPPDDVLSTARGQEAEARWWRKVQTLLPSVVFTSCISAVQALLLAALHLNNTNNKDSCWTLTGAAVRIAIAIGLHRDATLQHGSCVPQNLVLLLRKRLWWTLYQFELMQAASLDRPSAIDDAACNISPAIQLPVKMGADATMEYSTRLLRMLSQACRVVRTMNNSSSASGEDTDDSYSGPLSPAASLIRDMRRWRDNLPRELSQQAATMETSTYEQEVNHNSTVTAWSRRSLLLMHVQYHHTLCVITRNPMLTAASRLFDNSTSNNNVDDENRYRSNNLGVPEGGGGCNAFLTDVCIAAAQDSTRLLFRLDAEGLFDGVTWWDFYFLYQAAQVLVLGVMYDAKRGEDNRRQSPTTGGNSRLNTSRMLLHCCADLAGRVAQNPRVPGTIHRFAVVVGELVGSVEDFIVRGPAAGELDAVTTVPPNPAAANVPLPSSTGFPTMPDSGGDHHQQPPYRHTDDPDCHNNSNNPQISFHMDIDGATAVAAFQEQDGGIHHGEVGRSGGDLPMVGTPSLGIQFPADMAAHFGFPDGSWTYREGQWDDFGSMVLGGGGYGA